MDTVVANLSKLITGCDQIDQNAFDSTVRKWQSGSNKNTTIAEYLCRSGASDCTIDELAFISDVQNCQLSDSEFQINGFNVQQARLSADWFAKTGSKTTSGVLQVWENVLPFVAFANVVFRPQQSESSTISAVAERTISQTTGKRLASKLVTPAEVKTLNTNRLPTTGDMLGRCLLEKELGRGASSVVFQARHTKLGIRVAVKVLISGHSNQEDNLLAIIQHEAQLLAQINHPNVVRVFDVHDEGEWPYLVLEFVEGMSLATAISQGTLEIPEVISIAIRACEGLAAAYRLGVIHRDIKPENIVLTTDGQVKVVDFGVGLVAENSSTAQETQLVGTAQYISPEQAKCETGLDHRSDMYSLGATMYHALTGSPPFGAGSFDTLLLQHVAATPQRPRQLKANIPDNIERVVMRLLNKLPEQRYVSYDELIADLRQCLAPTQATPVTTKTTSLVSWLSRRAKSN